MWRKRRGSYGGGGNLRGLESPNLTANSNSITSMPSTVTTSSPFLGSDPNATDRPVVFTIEVPTPGPLGLDLRARHIERDKPQRGAVVKGFRPLSGGRRGYVENTGRVKVGDILQIIHKTPIDDMPFEKIVKHAMQLQKDPDAWPLSMEFRREPDKPEKYDSYHSSKPRRSSFFRSSISSISTPVQDGNFNDKLQYFRGFFANRIPTGGAAPKAKAKPPHAPKAGTVDEMYRELLLKRGVPDDVMDELIRIEPLETKWHVVWYAQQNENEDNTESNAAEAEKFAENLVELNWDKKGLNDLEALRNKISVASTDWLESFLSNFGLDYLTMKLPDPSPFPIEHSKYERATHICELILRILRSLTHFTAGVEAITNTPGLVKRVALCFHTENGDVKKYTLQLLGIVCYNSAAGHAAVIEAFDHYKETKGESIRFSCLRDALKSTRYSFVFKEDVLSFVNIIVNKAIKLEDRLAIRADFMALKMSGYFEEIRAKSLAMQRKKYPLATSAAASVAVEEAPSGASSPALGPSAAPSPVQGAHPSKRTPSPVLNNRVTHSPAVDPAKGPGTPKPEVDSLKPLEGQVTPMKSTLDRSLQDRLSASKSAPPSPIEREPAQLSPDGSIVRSSLPLDGKSPGNHVNGGNSIISSSVTQLRFQLDNMEKQIDVFEQFMEDDRKDTIYERTDLSSLESVFHTLSDSVANDSELQACLLSILQQLLFIPGDRVLGKEMWSLAERIMKQIGLLSPVEEVRNFELGYDDRKSLLKMRDRYTQFLQKCADEDPTFRFRMDPIILIENGDRDHSDDLALSEGTAEETDDEEVEVTAREHPELMKYFKLLKMGMPMPQVQLKMSSELQSFDPSILETPNKIIHVEKPEGDDHQGTRAEEHDKYAKFFKLKKMGMPMPHIQMKMSAEGLDVTILETPDLLLDEDGNEWKEGGADTGFVGIPVKDHEKFAKFFKLMKMGMPLEHIQLKASSEGLDGALLATPDQLLDEEGKIFIPGRQETAAGIAVKDHEKFAKFFKLMKMGMPLEHIKMKASSEGLDGELLSTPEALLNEDGSKFVVGAAKGIPVKDHEKFTKFFKLMKMGMPLEHIKMKASSEGLDGELLSTPDALLNEDGSKFEEGAAAVKGIPVKEHEKFAKFFKLMKMGMPLEHIKMKASSEGLDGELLATPDVLLDEEGKKLEATGVSGPAGVPVKEHEKFAKFFKLLKMGMPMEHVKLKVSSEGLDGNLLETPDKLLDEDGKEVVGGAAVVKGTPVKDHEKFAKFFKLLKMGMPLEQVKLKASSEGLDGELLATPDKLVDADGKEVAAAAGAVKGTPVKEHAKFVKFFKLLKMGMPMDHVKLKASAEGLDGELLATPDTLVDDEGKEVKSGVGKTIKASEHPSYAKYFKLLKMGMPRPQLELKMSAESLDVKVLDTPDAMIPEDLSGSASAAPAKPVVKAPPKPKLRNLYWEAVKDDDTSGTIWESFAKEEAQKSKDEAAPTGPVSVKDLFAAKAKAQNPGKDESDEKKDEVLEKFVDQLADIFVNKPAKAKETEKKKPIKRRAPTRVALIDAKRANNIGIMLARFRLPYFKLRNAVLLVDKEMLSAERVSALLQFAPEPEEIEAVKGYTGDPKLLGDAEQYFRDMLCVPRLTTRLQAIHATWQFDTYVEEQQKLMDSVANACQEVQECSALKEIFRVVLSLGNALNDGTARGGAKGFRLNILLKLNQVKSSDNSTNLLNYVAKVLRAKDPAILEFDKSLPSVEAASRVTIQVLKAGETAVRKAAGLICNELEMHAKLPEKEYPQPEPVEGEEGEPEKISDRFQDEIKPFADRAKKTSDDIKKDLDSMTKRFEETASYYGEDPTSPDCGPDAFFSIFYSFAKVLQAADRDNERKRIAEERRVRREQETKKRLEQLKLKKQKKQTSYASLKTGDVDDIVSKIRAKRVQEKRRELLAKPFDGTASSSSVSSAGRGSLSRTDPQRNSASSRDSSSNVAAAAASAAQSVAAVGV